MIRGIDISHWQGEVNFSIVKQHNINFVIMKATDFFRNREEGFRDVRVERNVFNAKQEKLNYGLYMWLQPRWDAEKQAGFFLKALKDYGSTICPVVDFEDTAYTSINDYAFKLKTVLEIIRSEINHIPIVYSRNTFIQLIPPNRRGWLREYFYHRAWYPYKFPTRRQHSDFFTPAKMPEAVSPFNKTDIWQFTSQGDGVRFGASSNFLDLNYSENLPTMGEAYVPQPPTPIKRVEITATLGLRIRQRPDVNSMRLGVIPFKNNVLVDEELSTRDFYKLYNQEGYIYKGFTKDVN